LCARGRNRLPPFLELGVNVRLPLGEVGDFLASGDALEFLDQRAVVVCAA
jgi:hypothetical protein